MIAAAGLTAYVPASTRNSEIKVDIPGSARPDKPEINTRAFAANDQITPLTILNSRLNSYLLP